MPVRSRRDRTGQGTEVIGPGQADVRPAHPVPVLQDDPGDIGPGGHAVAGRIAIGPRAEGDVGQDGRTLGQRGGRDGLPTAADALVDGGELPTLGATLPADHPEPPIGRTLDVGQPRVATTRRILALPALAVASHGIGAQLATGGQAGSDRPGLASATTHGRQGGARACRERQGTESRLRTVDDAGRRHERAPRRPLEGSVVAHAKEAPVTDELSVSEAAVAMSSCHLLPPRAVAPQDQGTGIAAADDGRRLLAAHHDLEWRGEERRAGDAHLDPTTRALGSGHDGCGRHRPQAKDTREHERQGHADAADHARATILIPTQRPGTRPAYRTSRRVRPRGQATERWR